MFGSCLSIKIFCRLKYTYRYQYKTSDIKWNHLKDVKGYVNQTSFKYGQVITPPPPLLKLFLNKTKEKEWDIHVHVWISQGRNTMNFIVAVKLFKTSLKFRHSGVEDTNIAFN